MKPKCKKSVLVRLGADMPREAGVPWDLPPVVGRGRKTEGKAKLGSQPSDDFGPSRKSTGARMFLQGIPRRF